MTQKPMEKVRASFASFAQKISTVKTTSGPRSRGWSVEEERNRARAGASATGDYTVETIKEIIRGGVPSELETLSLHFYRASGIYTHMIHYLSNLLLFDTVVVPKARYGLKKPTNEVMLKKFQSALDFIEDLRVKETFSRITNQILVHGAYYGLVRDFGGKSIIVQDLDGGYCRSRHKSERGIDILEFDLRYFDFQHLLLKEEAKELLDSFPPNFRTAYNEYKQNPMNNWYEVPEDQGIVFANTDNIPYLIASLPSCLMYDEAQDDERKRDQQELEKLLIVSMPISTASNEPVFDLDETVAMHEGMAEMLSEADYVNVLTTFGTAKLEDAQSATQASRDKLIQYKRATYDAIGSSASLFNAEGNVALEYSVNRDTAAMLSFADRYAKWLTYQINRRLGSAKLEFDVEILPTTIYNRERMANMYLKGAQFGYSKMYAGSALGIKQGNLTSLVDFENDVLGLADRLVPLQSSHTQSLKKGEKDQDGGGRPSLPETQKDDKTIANNNG